MQKYVVKFTPKASNELYGIFEYIFVGLKDPFGANRIIRNIYKKCEGLSTFPKVSPVRVIKRGKELRFIHVRHYMVVYYIDEKNEIVYITHIIYSKRDVFGLID